MIAGESILFDFTCIGWLLGARDFTVYRETLRMASLAYCINSMGYRVRVANVPECVKEKPIWSVFRKLEQNFSCDLVVTTEKMASTFKSKNTCVGLFKETRRKVGDVSRLLTECDFLIATEFDPPEVEQPHLLPVTWQICTLVLDELYSQGLLEAYLKNDLARIRKAYSAKKIHKVGFYGGLFPKRQNDLLSLQEAASGVEYDVVWTEWKKHETAIPSGEYLRKLISLDAGLCFEGDCFKTMRFSELTMLGIPVVMTPPFIPDHPEITSENTILLKDWYDEKGLQEGLNRRDKIVVAANEDYLNGWSPMGQAKQILKRFGL